MAISITKNRAKAIAKRFGKFAVDLAKSVASTCEGPAEAYAAWQEARQSWSAVCLETAQAFYKAGKGADDVSRFLYMIREYFPRQDESGKMTKGYNSISQALTHWRKATKEHGVSWDQGSDDDLGKVMVATEGKRERERVHKALESASSWSALVPKPKPRKDRGEDATAGKVDVPAPTEMPDDYATALGAVSAALDSLADIGVPEATVDALKHDAAQAVYRIAKEA